MEPAKTLIRTVVRTFYDTRSALIIDALLIHSVLDAADLGILLSSHPKDVRKYINPLRSARLLATHTRLEARVGSSSNRGVQHEYYYIPLHPAVDAIKYRIMRLKRKVEQLYQHDISKKAWRCPHCKAEYEELEVLDHVGDEGFLCHRCNHVLEPTEDAAEPSGNHEKIRRLNTQLNKFENIILQIDAQQVPENNFFEAWERKKDVPRLSGTGQQAREYIALSSRNDGRIKGPDQVDANALNVNITSGAELDKEEEAKHEARRAELAKQNQLPVWHTQSAIGTNGVAVKPEADSLVNGALFKKEEPEDKKPDVSMQSELDAYVAEMEREKVEEERKRAIEDVDSAEGDEDEDDFEDVVSTSAMGTPASSQQMANGAKRDLDSSGPSSEAGTPASISEQGAKRVKFEDGAGSLGPAVKLETGNDEEEDEGDFEDAM